MAKERLRVRGLKEMVAKIEAAARAGGAANASGTRIVADAIASDVRMSRPGAGVPKDTGNLAANTKAEGPDARGASRIVSGGSAAPYALRQHETLQYRHTLGEARYLVRGLERFLAGGGLRAVQDTMLRAAVAAMRRA